MMSWALNFELENNLKLQGDRKVACPEWHLLKQKTLN